MIDPALMERADRIVSQVVEALGSDQALNFFIDALKQYAPEAFEAEEIDLEDLVEFLSLELEETRH